MNISEDFSIYFSSSEHTQSVAIFLKPIFPDTKVVFASFAFGKILVTCYIPKLEKGKQISDD